MNRLIAFFYVGLIFSSFSFCQFSEEVPNYIKAKNSNFIVSIITMEDLSVSTEQSYISKIPHSSMERIRPEDYSSLDEGLFNAISFFINQEFEKLNMAPSGFINMNMRAMADPNFMKETAEQYFGIKPGFMVMIFCSDWSKAKKAFKKNKLSPKEIKPISFSIIKMGEENPQQPFAINKMNMSLSTTFEVLKKKISKKPKTYFIENMEIDEDNFLEKIINSPLYDKMVTENESIEGFPNENELKENEILVISYGKPDDMYYKHSLKQLKKYYPYKYKLLNGQNDMEDIDEKYKYILMAKTYLAKKTTTRSSSGSSMQSKTKTKTVSMFYYVIKDIETKNIYYGNNRTALENNASSSPSVGLKRTLKLMKEHYNWEKK